MTYTTYASTQSTNILKKVNGAFV